MSPLSLSNLRQALEEKFFEMTKYVRTMDVIPVIVNIVVKVLLINLMTKRVGDVVQRISRPGEKQKIQRKESGK